MKTSPMELHAVPAPERGRPSSDQAPSLDLHRLQEELALLKKVGQRREVTLEHLLEATLMLRRGNLALREENHELRRELRRLRSRHAQEAAA